MLAACQVRVAMCQQLPPLAHVAGRDVVARAILPEVLELLRDEELKVRCAPNTR